MSFSCEAVRPGERPAYEFASEDRRGVPDESRKGRIEEVTNLMRLARMVRLALKASTWLEILKTP